LPKAYRITLLVEPSTSYGRDLLRGIARYARTRANWYFQFEHAASSHEVLHYGVPEADGVILRHVLPETVAELKKRGMAVVHVGAERKTAELPGVTVDDPAVGRVAAKYFIQRGYRRFAACGFPERLFSSERIAGYLAALAEKGIECQEHRQPSDVWAATPVPDRTALLVPWLKTLRGPLAVFCCNDEMGRHVVEACRLAEVRVPEDLAVLGVDNDEVLCELSNPPLSSVELGAERLGYRAATLMARLLYGKDAPAEIPRIAPVGVVTRRSTDHLPIEDPLINAALRFVWEHSAEGLQVRDLVRALKVSRRWIELRFQRVLGCSPASQIRNVQIEHAKKLLAESDLLMPVVAANAGFGDAKLLIAVFRREVGMTPTEYRDKYRLR
jgi:LacI family transcriptional regulator